MTGLAHISLSDDNPQLRTVPESSESTTREHRDTHNEQMSFSRNQYASASHVKLDVFDPEGVHDLQLTLNSTSLNTAMSAQQPASTEKRAQSGMSDDTDATLYGPIADPFDFEKFFRKYLRKREEAHIPMREVGVAFSDLRVVGVGATTSFQPTLGSVLNPLNLLGTIQGMRHPGLHDILSGFEGVVRPGEMLLVLGRPGAGCTTLLKTLANHWEGYHKVEGEVNFDSLTPAEIASHYRGDVQYCPEDDIHFPTLTVAQTLAFAAKTRVPQGRFDHVTRQAYIDKTVDVLTTVFGLKHVRDTPVGDASLRGVSGGEKKRVSIAEALATRSRLHAWDNSTRGLDASTALEFIQALRIATDLAHVTTIVSMYQAGESLYKLFNKVCVIYEGKMAYFGPADRARQYFVDMGYEPKNRQTSADFLVSVTDTNGRIIRAGMSGQPRTADEFAAYFRQSQDAQANSKDLAAYRAEFVGKANRASAYVESALGEHSRHTRPSSPYIMSVPMQVRAVMLRRLQIIRGGLAYQIINFSSFIIQGIIVGTVFFRTPDATVAYFSRGGVLYFSLLFTAFSSFAEISALYAQRPIVARHQLAALYHPFIEAVALTLVDMGISFVIMAVFCILIYFLVRLQQTVGQFFIFFLFIYTMAQTVKAFFRFTAALFEFPPAAHAFAGLLLLTLVMYTGYTIPKPSMIGALRWITYINPLRYGFESMITNEFHTLHGVCSSLVPSGPGYADVSIQNQVCTTVGSAPGQMDVNGNAYVAIAYGYYYKNIWRNFGIVLAFGIGFFILLLVSTESRTSISSHHALITLFKRGSKASVVQEAKEAASSDEEKANQNTFQQAPPSNEEVETVMKSQEEMTDVFSWQHLSYSVPVHGGVTRELLDDVSGFVAPGKLTALMGETGAGKTTLLNALAERTTTGVVTGDRFVNGHAVLKDFQRQTGYCQQLDTHLPSATVREAVLFSAKLRQPASVPLAEKEAYVETVLKMCGLGAYGDAVIGTLSGENRKRTTIAVELAAKPKLLLFLDEPTSGLDSQSAWAVITFLRSLADYGQAILCTIHQPSAELFQVFDRLLLLKKGGQTVYFGDIGHNAETLIHYFENHGSRPCEPGENPAEFILQVIGAGATAVVEKDWNTIWNESDEAQAVQADLDRIHEEGQKKKPAVHESDHREYATSWFYQVAELAKRDAMDHWRNPIYLIAKLNLNIFGGLLMGFTFFNAKDTLQGSQNKIFAIFMGAILSVPLGNQIQLGFLDMRNVYEIRERPSQIYSWTALITSQILVEIPWNILGTALFFLCWYWTVGFDNDRAGYTYLLFGVVFPIYYSTMAQAVASMAPSADIAAILSTFLFNFIITFNGVLQPFRLLGWWKWMYHVTPYTYLISGLVGQAIGNQEVSCSDVEYAILIPPSGQSCGSYMQEYISTRGGYLVNPDATSVCQFCADRTTDQLLGPTSNIFYSQHWRNFGIFCVFTAFNIFAVYALTYLFRIKGGAIIRYVKNLIPRRSSQTRMFRKGRLIGKI